MSRIDRRSFLSLTSSSLVLLANIPRGMLKPRWQLPLFAHPNNESCWLDVCAPFIMEDEQVGIQSEIVLTSDTFVGPKGFEDGVDATEYELYLYDAMGRRVGTDVQANCLSVPAMKTTVIKVSELIGTRKSFWGGLTIRLRPRCRQRMHASDLFSSAFVRWKTNASFTNVHANPDPLQWQVARSFFYSLPFPPLRQYACFLSLFNPNSTTSRGTVALHDPLGTKLREIPYELLAYSSLILDLSTTEYLKDIKTVLRRMDNDSRAVKSELIKSEGGTVVVCNDENSVKSFGYLFMVQTNRGLFSVEHPIHQTPFSPLPATSAFDVSGRFAAKNILYTPLVFRSKRIAGVTLESRFHLSSGAPLEEHLWLKPFIVNAQGEVAWQVVESASLEATIPRKQIEHEAIKLGARQSCIFDCGKINLPKDFSGGLGLAITPNSNHTLMKVEITVREWGASAFTHFRPGLRSARSYQLPEHRGGIATDYVASGARLESKANKILRDEIIGIINIDDKMTTGNPSLEIFDSSGFVGRVKLGQVPAFSCRHYVLSELLSGKTPATDLTLRLVDETAILLMSIVHLDYGRRDIAADHGSDRFSTFGEYNCQAKIPG